MFKIELKSTSIILYLKIKNQNYRKKTSNIFINTNNNDGLCKPDLRSCGNNFTIISRSLS